MNRFPFCPLVLAALLCCACIPASHAQEEPANTTPLEHTSVTRRGDLAADATFVSRGDGVTLLLQQLAAQMQVSVIVSNKAQKKRVEGSFALRQPRPVLDHVARDLGMVWYNDGQTLYVYDASETRNAVGHM